jgi:hypothetical protein
LILFQKRNGQKRIVQQIVYLSVEIKKKVQAKTEFASDHSFLWQIYVMMFLHLFLGDLQITPLAYRVLKSNKTLQLLKLEIVHDNQLTEYGVLSKDPKVESLFPFHQTLHIPVDHHNLMEDDEDEDTHANSPKLQKLSFALFAVVGEQEQMIKLGSGVATSSKSEKEITKTIIFRNDKFELIGKLLITTFYNQSLVDMADFMKFKKNTAAASNEPQNEYSFLLSRKFRRGEPDFPSTFDKSLENKLIEDSEYYIKKLHTQNKSEPNSLSNTQQGRPRSNQSPGITRRSTSNSKIPLSRQSVGDSSNIHKRAVSASANQKKVFAAFSPAGHLFSSAKHHHHPHQHNPSHHPDSHQQHLIQAAAEAPRLRKTVMSVGYVHNAWPDPHENEKSKKEYQLRMANERKKQLLQLIAQEIEFKKQSKKLQEEKMAAHHHQHHPTVEEIHQKKLLKEKEKEDKQKKKLTKELKNREHEIHHLQEKLREIRMQSILTSHFQSPPTEKQHPLPSTSVETGKKTAMKERSKSPTTLPTRRQHKSPPLTATITPHPATQHNKPAASNLNHLLEHHYGNFFKSPLPKAPLPENKKKLEKGKKSSKTTTKKKPQQQLAPASHEPLIAKNGNKIIQVSVKRNPVVMNYQTTTPTLKYNRYFDRSEDDAAIEKQMKEKLAKDRLLAAEQWKRSPEFSFHEVYEKDKSSQNFNSDSPFTKMNATKKTSKVSKKTKKGKKNFENQQEREEDAEEEEDSFIQESDNDEDFMEMKFSSPLRRKEDDDNDIEKELDTSLANEIKTQNQNFIAQMNQQIENKSKQNLQGAADYSFESEEDESFKVPGFLQAMIQSNTFKFPESVQYKATSLLEKMQETLESITTTKDQTRTDLDDEEEEEDVMDDEEFETKFHLHVDESGDSEEENDVEDYEENKKHRPVRYSQQKHVERKESKREEEEEERDSEEESFLPMKDMNYPDFQFALKSHLSDEEEIDLKDSSDEEEGENERKQQSRHVFKPPSKNVQPETERKSNESDLNPDDKYDYHYAATTTAEQRGRTLQRSNINGPDKTNYPLTRPKSKEKILLQFEKNRNYSRPTVSSLSAGSISNSKEEVHLGRDSSNLSRRHNETDFREVEDLISSTNRAIDDVISGSQKFEEEQRAQLGKMNHSADSELSDEDTVENNIMDTMSFNEKLLHNFSDPFSFDEDDQEEEGGGNPSFSSVSPPSSSMKPTVTGGGRPPLTAKSLQSSSQSSTEKASPIVDDRQENSAKPSEQTENSQSFEEIIKGKSPSFYQPTPVDSYQEKMDKITSRINSLLSETTPSMKDLLDAKKTFGKQTKAPSPIRKFSNDGSTMTMNKSQDENEIVPVHTNLEGEISPLSSKESPMNGRSGSFLPFAADSSSPFPVTNPHGKLMNISTTGKHQPPELSPAIMEAQAAAAALKTLSLSLTPSSVASDKKSVSFRPEIVASIHEITPPANNNINNEEDDNVNGTLRKENGELNYSKPTISRSFIERQFEKNRKYSSNSNPTSSKLQPFNSSEKLVEEEEKTPFEEPLKSGDNDNKKEEKEEAKQKEPALSFINTKSFSNKIKTADASANEKIISPWRKQPADGRVKAIISQFEKNKQYCNSNSDSNKERTTSNENNNNSATHEDNLPQQAASSSLLPVTKEEKDHSNTGGTHSSSVQSAKEENMKSADDWIDIEKKLNNLEVTKLSISSLFIILISIRFLFSSSKVSSEEHGQTIRFFHSIVERGNHHLFHNEEEY